METEDPLRKINQYRLQVLRIFFFAKIDIFFYELSDLLRLGKMMCGNIKRFF